MEETILRPSMAFAAYQALSVGRKIEVQNENLFSFLRFLEKNHKGELKIECKVNELNKGWTLLVNESASNPIL
jgi:hypothetical protein